MTDIELDDATLWQLEEGHGITESVAFHGPPGTGKTTTAAATVARLIRDHGYDISDVAWVTYRRSLARDTLVRLAEWDVLDERHLDNPTQGPTRYIGTAHAVARRCGGVARDPIYPSHRRDFCKKKDIQYQTHEPWEKSPGKLLFRVFDWLASAHTTPENDAKRRECPHLPELRNHWRGDVVEAWHEWQAYKDVKDRIDFHEMLQRPLEEGRSPQRPILVIDEYHDVTQLMHDLFTSWMGDAEIVLVAGDPHQVVNAYDGASPRYFQSLDLPTVLLPKSFRCRQNHWEAATRLLQNAHDPPNVEVGDGGPIRDYNSPVYEYSSASGDWERLPAPGQQASPGWIVDNFEGSTLFLTRTRMQAAGVGAALEAAGVPYRSQRQLRGWNTEAGARKLHIHNALQKIKGLSPASFTGGSGLLQFADMDENPTSVPLTYDEAAILLRTARAKHLDVSRSEATEQADDWEETAGTISADEFDAWVEPKFWERYTGGGGSVDHLINSPFANADRDKHAVQKALARHEGPIDPADIDTWAITIHASKGMEADDVVVYDGISNRIQEEMRTRDRTRNNEYRVWYVALTRARRRLHIMRNAFGYTVPIIPGDITEG